MQTRSMTAALIALPAALVLAACSVGGASVSQSDVESQISQQLEAQVGQAPDTVTCPGDLKAEAGAVMDCSLTAGDETYGVTVTVTSVDGSNVLFDISVGEATP